MEFVCIRAAASSVAANIINRNNPKNWKVLSFSFFIRGIDEADLSYSSNQELNIKKKMVFQLRLDQFPIKMSLDPDQYRKYSMWNHLLFSSFYVI